MASLLVEVHPKSNINSSSHARDISCPSHTIRLHQSNLKLTIYFFRTEVAEITIMQMLHRWILEVLRTFRGILDQLYSNFFVRLTPDVISLHIFYPNVVDI
jgi:hypothetical protein